MFPPSFLTNTWPQTLDIKPTNAQYLHAVDHPHMLNCGGAGPGRSQIPKFQATPSISGPLCSPGQCRARCAVTSCGTAVFAPSSQHAASKPPRRALAAPQPQPRASSQAGHRAAHAQAPGKAATQLGPSVSPPVPARARAQGAVPGRAGCVFPRNTPFPNQRLHSASHLTPEAAKAAL